MPVNDILEIGTLESILPFKLFLVNLDKNFSSIFTKKVVLPEPYPVCRLPYESVLFCRWMGAGV